MGGPSDRSAGRIGKATLVVWFVVMTILSAGLLARHLFAMPVPTKTVQLGRALMELSHRPPTWLAVHVLDSECRCSQRIAAHLVESDRPHGWSEIVLWVGELQPPAELVQRFDVRRVTGAELAKLDIEAAPLLVVVSPNAEVRYVGGYTDRKQGPVIHDVELLASARAATARPLPVFGCATSSRLRQALSALPVP